MKIEKKKKKKNRLIKYLKYFYFKIKSVSEIKKIIFNILLKFLRAIIIYR